MKDIGEDGFIDGLRSVLGHGSHADYIGDDCAVVNVGKEKLALTTDSVIEGRHFDKNASPYAIGTYAAGVSISDLAATGAKPMFMLVSLIMPPKTDTVAAKQIMKGIKSACNKFGVTIIGGDTKQGRLLAINTTAVGRLDKKSFMKRSGARPGDIIALTGTIGKSADIIDKWKSNKKKNKSMERALDIAPRVREGKMLLDAGVKCCTDLSDGIGRGLVLLGSASGCEITIETEKIPVYSGLKKRIGISKGWLELAMSSGDYELLFCAKPAVIAKLRKKMKLYPIGVVKRGSGVFLCENGKIKKSKYKGYRHFS